MRGQFEDLKQKMAEQWKNLESRILESNSFNHLKEKYQSLSLRRQKLIRYSALFLVFSALAYLPLSYFLSSTAYWREFKDKQDISLDLLRMRNKIASSVFRYSWVQLKMQIRRTAEKYSDVDLKIEDKESVFSGGESVQQVDFKIRMDHLNVKQAVRLGVELHDLPQTRLEAVTMEENKAHPKHYDVTYQLRAFVSGEAKKGMAVKKRRQLKKGEKTEKKEPAVQDFETPPGKSKQMDREAMEKKALRNVRKRRKERDKKSLQNVRKRRTGTTKDKKFPLKKEDSKRSSPAKGGLENRKGDWKPAQPDHRGSSSHQTEKDWTKPAWPDSMEDKIKKWNTEAER